MSDLQTVDRTSIRQRPSGWPVMYQTWDKLLFLHWPVEVQQLRPLVPARLEIDTWDGTAWIGVTPFTIRGIRPPMAPPLPVISTSHELNVRTYVHHDGMPGIWFLSLDASNLLAVWGARLSYLLPYFHAEMDLQSSGDKITFHSKRTHRGADPADFDATWEVGPGLPPAEPGTRDFFLIERYALYTSDGEHLYRARIDHHPWPLRSAEVEQLSSSVVESHGVSVQQQSPLVHAQAAPLHVGIWRPTRVG